MQIRIDHHVATHSIDGLNQTSTVIATRDDGKVIEGMCEIRGGKRKAYVLIENTTELGIRQAKAVLAKIASTGVGEWEMSWADITDGICGKAK